MYNLEDIEKLFSDNFLGNKHAQVDWRKEDVKIETAICQANNNKT